MGLRGCNSSSFSSGFRTWTLRDQLGRDLGGTALKKIIEDAGLKCISSHFNMGEMRDELDQSLEWAQEMGINQVICSSFWLPEEVTVDDFRRSCDELNQQKWEV